MTPYCQMTQRPGCSALWAVHSLGENAANSAAGIFGIGNPTPPTLRAPHAPADQGSELAVGVQRQLTHGQLPWAVAFVYTKNAPAMHGRCLIGCSSRQLSIALLIELE